VSAPDAPLTTQTVDGTVGPLAYRRQGAGRPLVLLHPLALSSEIWSGFAAGLTDRFDVIAVDARGHGASGWDGKPFGIDDLADDVIALLDRLELASACVIGMSMGGSTAVSLAGRHPDRVDAMVLADTTAWYGEKAPATWEERAQNVVATSRERQVPFQADRWFSEPFRRRNTAEVNRVVDVFLRTDSLAHAEACRALGNMDSRPLLAAITAPVLVLTGEEDYATPPPMAAVIADGVEQGEARVLEDLRHLSLVEDPSLSDVAAEFLTAAVEKAQTDQPSHA
jgi:3-oxoadipate enol-lactonase